MCSLKRKPGAARQSKLASVALRTASGLRRRSSPSSSIRSKAYRKTLASWRRYRMRSKLALRRGHQPECCPAAQQRDGTGGDAHAIKSFNPY
jgi:hypothetical protein